MTTFPTSVFLKICHLLDEHGIEYVVKEHEPTHTSEESAAARGDDLKVGGKALVLKADKRFVLFVIPADMKLNSKTAKQLLGARKLRFASREELKELTGLVPGSVPPFGRPILDFDIYVDSSVYENDSMSFNAGDLCRSITLASVEHRRVVRPAVCDAVATR